jgi:two-component system CheB/CheR fusion protein
MVLTEAAERLDPRWGGSLQIFATDLDSDAIDRARRGLYPAGIAADLTPERLDRFFVPEDGAYRISKEIRSAVVFAPHNVGSDPPFTRMDIVSCRNLLIYFAAELQHAIISTFHYALSPGGILVLGNAETIGGKRDLFEPVGGRERIFRRLDAGGEVSTADWPLAFGMTREEREIPDTEHVSPSLRSSADRLLLDRHAPAAVLATAGGDILYINGRTGDYLEPAAGKANWNLHVMARDGLRTPLMSAFRRALAGRVPIALTGVEVVTGGSPITLDVTVEPVLEPGPLRDTVLVVFARAHGPAPRRRTRARRPAAGPEEQLEVELLRTREELEVMREDMQASLEELKSSNEELQSTNEELQSTNEELQSTNEELTTSKEELQSMNEELQVVNAELSSRVEELMSANSDMQNLINSSEIATVFLDSRLRIRRFTSSATDLISLIPSDVGRPLSDVTNELDYPTLMADVETVLRTLASIDRQVTTRSGGWYAARIVPYRTLSNVIDGVVVTFSDISRLKQLELTLAARTAENAEPPEGGSRDITRASGVDRGRRAAPARTAGPPRGAPHPERGASPGPRRG